MDCLLIWNIGHFKLELIQNGKTINYMDSQIFVNIFWQVFSTNLCQVHMVK